MATRTSCESAAVSCRECKYMRRILSDAEVGPTSVCVYHRNAILTSSEVVIGGCVYSTEMPTEHPTVKFDTRSACFVKVGPSWIHNEDTAINCKYFEKL